MNRMRIGRLSLPVAARIEAKSVFGPATTSARVSSSTVARAAAVSGSRRRPAGSSASSPPGSEASISSRSTSRCNARCWKPSSSTKQSIGNRSRTHRPRRYRSVPTATTAPGHRHAIRCGSSPASAGPSRIVRPSETSNCGARLRRRYPLLSTPTRLPRASSHSAIEITTGVFPVPPTVRLPTLTTRQGSLRRGSQPRS